MNSSGPIYWGKKTRIYCSTRTGFVVNSYHTTKIRLRLKELCGSLIFTARIRGMREGNSFSLFVCPHPGGGGLPHIHPIILPLVPCPFQGVPYLYSHNTSSGPMSFLRGYPGVCPSQVPPSWDGVPPVLGWGTPRPDQDSKVFDRHPDTV